MSNAALPPWLPHQRCRRELGVSGSTIYRLIHAKKLTKFKISERASEITADSLAALLQSGQHLKAV